MNTEHATAPLDESLTHPPGETPICDLLTSRGEAPADSLMQALKQHHNTLCDYCTLALQPSLSTADQDRLGEILAEAVDDPLLSFWLEEADCWVEEQLHLLPEDILKQQQYKLKRLIGQTWVDNLWADLQHRTKALQTYLKRVGVYSGAIDGVMGPTTQHAVESLKTAYPDELPLGYL